MPHRDLIEAWAALIILSFGTVVLATAGVSGTDVTFVAAAVLMLAALKARVILTRYLALASSRFWTRVFDLAIGFFLLLCFVLHTFGSGGANG